MERLEPRPYSPPRRQPAEPARVPRRFGMGTLLLAVTLYGLLFSLLQATGASWGVYLVVSGYLALIALAQMLLFGGKKPRLASFVAGGACGSVLGVCGAVVDHANPAQWPAYAFQGFFLGGLLGYAAGCLLAGVFLLLKSFQKREPDPADDTPFAIREDEPEESDVE